MQKKIKIKGWARLDSDGDVLEVRNLDDWQSETIKAWRRKWSFLGKCKTVPCTISYTLPTKPKKK